jgi:uncharacterized protein (TIGR02271 family)
MSQNDARQVGDWVKRTAVDSAGDKVGTITDVYVDDQTGDPDWLANSTGLFGSKVSFVPIEGARLTGDDVVVAFDKAMIKDAPNTEADGQLSVEEEQVLYSYYGRGYESTAATNVATPPATTAPTATTEQITADRGGRDASMVRSEEELAVDKHTREAGRVRLRKWVETENVQVTVPVEKQVARVVRENVADGDTTTDAFTEGEEEIVLSEEVVDVSKRAVAKERVGLEKETVTENVAVDEQVRKERVGVEGGELVGDDRGDTPRR